MDYQESDLMIGLRRNLCEVLETEFKDRKIADYHSVLAVLQRTPRHLFLAKGLENLAYQNQSVEIDAYQTISKPWTVAFQTYLLQLQHADTVLEIGTGSGYQAAVLSPLCKEVFTLERHKILHQQAKSLFKELKLRNISTFFKDGFEGLPQYAPFDKILITCAVPEMPEKLFAQLKIGGLLVAPFDDEDGRQDMIRYIKVAENQFEKEVFEKFDFVPMLKGIS